MAISDSISVLKAAQLFQQNEVREDIVLTIGVVQVIVFCVKYDGKLFSASTPMGIFTISTNDRDRIETLSLYTNDSQRDVPISVIEASFLQLPNEMSWNETDEWMNEQ